MIRRQAWIGISGWVRLRSALSTRRFIRGASGNFSTSRTERSGDWGVHWMDQVLWWTEETHPKSVYSTAGRFVREDSTDAPDTQIVTYEFDTFRCTWEQRHYAGNNAEQHLIGAYFYGTEGTFHMGWRDGWTFYPAKKSEKIIHVEPQLNDPDGQNIKELWADFMQAIATQAQTGPRYRDRLSSHQRCIARHGELAPRQKYPVGRESVSEGCRSK